MRMEQKASLPSPANAADRTMALSEPRILAVDDSDPIRRLLRLVAGASSFPCDTAGTVQEASRLIQRNHYDIVFLDYQLPDGTGMDLLEERRAHLSQTMIVMVSAEHELNTVVQLIRKGTYDFIPKPFTREALEERLEKVVEEWRSRVQLRHYQQQLEGLVKSMTEKLVDSSARMERIYDMTVAALGAAMDLRDPETEEHCRRVAENSAHLGRALGLEANELKNLRWGAYLHDIGKIGIPESILLKPSALLPEEMEVVKSHPVLGFRMISHIEFLKDTTDVVLYHHERYDGSGYPYGLVGPGIPLAARIFAVIDTMDAMVYDRPYRKALPFSGLVEEVQRQAGRHLDPGIVERFLEIPETVWQVGARQEERYPGSVRPTLLPGVPLEQGEESLWKA